MPPTWRHLLLVFALMLAFPGNSTSIWPSHDTLCGDFLTNVEAYLVKLEATSNDSSRLSSCFLETRPQSRYCDYQFMVTSGCATREDLSSWAEQTATNCGESTSFRSSFADCHGLYYHDFCTEAGAKEGAGSYCLGTVYTNDCAMEGDGVLQGVSKCDLTMVTVAKRQGTAQYLVHSALTTTCGKLKGDFSTCSSNNLPIWKDWAHARPLPGRAKWYAVGGALLVTLCLAIWLIKVVLSNTTIPVVIEEGLPPKGDPNQGKVCEKSKLKATNSKAP